MVRNLEHHFFCIDLVYRDSTGTFQRRIDSLCDSYYPWKSLQTSRIESYRNSLSIFDSSVNAALSALARDCFGASFSIFSTSVSGRLGNFCHLFTPLFDELPSNSGRTPKKRCEKSVKLARLPTHRAVRFGKP